jgi:hypothetical protein
MADVYQANDPKQVESKKRKAARIAEQQSADLKLLLTQTEFRRFIWRHVHETCGLLRDPFTANGSVQTYNIGMQAVARILWTEIEAADPEVIPKMMLEYAESLKL